MCNDPNNASLSRPFPVLSRLNAVAATVPQTGVCRACLSGLHADADAIACKAAQLLPVRRAFMRSGCGAQHVTGPTPTGPPGARGAQPSAGLPALADGSGPRTTRALACRGAGLRAGHRTACRASLRPGGGARADQVRPRGRGRAARTSHARAAPAAAVGLHAGVARAAGLGPHRRGAAMPGRVAAAGRARPSFPDVQGHGAAAVRPPCRGRAGVPAGAGAEDRRRLPALPPGHLVPATGHEGRSRGMRAHRGHAGRGFERARGARPTRVPGARSLPLA